MNFQIPDFYSTALKAKTVGKKTVRLRTFPDYLWIQLKKFAVAENWTPYKLDVEIKMPDEIDLGCLKSKGGLQPGEEQLPEEEVIPSLTYWLFGTMSEGQKAQCKDPLFD